MHSGTTLFKGNSQKLNLVGARLEPDYKTVIHKNPGDLICSDLLHSGIPTAQVVVCHTSHMYNPSYKSEFPYLDGRESPHVHKLMVIGK
jgi:hypothetical protein